MKYILKIEIDFEVESKNILLIQEFITELANINLKKGFEIKGMEFNFIEVN